MLPYQLILRARLTAKKEIDGGTSPIGPKQNILERDFAAVDVVRNLIVDEVAVDITPCLKPGGSLAGHTAGRQSVVRYQESRIHLDGIFFCEPHFYASTRRKFVCHYCEVPASE